MSMATAWGGHSCRAPRKAMFAPAKRADALAGGQERELGVPMVTCWHDMHYCPPTRSNNHCPRAHVPSRPFAWTLRIDRLRFPVYVRGKG